MTKEEIKAQLKSLAIEIQAHKKIARNHDSGSYKQSISQSKMRKAASEARGLLIAYAYLNGKPFSAPEKNLYDAKNHDQYMAMVEAKKVLGMTEARVYPSMTVHKPLPNKEFDEWLTNTVSAAQ
jgi:hypothetical protein